MLRRPTYGSTLGSAGRFEPPMRPVAPAAQAVHAAPSHVVGAHSPRVPRSSGKEERGTVVWMLEEGVSAYCAEVSDPSK